MKEKLKTVAINAAGAFVIISGLGNLIYSIPSGIIMILAGIFLLPKTRSIIETKADTELQIFEIIAIFGILFMISTIILMTAVDVAEEGPEFMRPHL